MLSNLEQSALKSKESIIDVGSNNNIVVSLTTYSKRINQVHLVIESISRQSIRPNKIILWLDKSEFSECTLPVVLKSQESRGLEIRYCDNLKSYKKLIPTLMEFKSSNIITVDDDILYPYFLIEGFVKDSKNYKDTVLCYRGHGINIQELTTYSKWDLFTNSKSPSRLLFPTGVGGVYYPKGSLHEGVTNYELAKRLAPNGDDIWFKAMSLKNNVNSKIVSLDFCWENDFFEIEDGKDISLSIKNLQQNENNKQIENVFKELYLIRYLDN
ncbi:hypothetical protein [Vibrio breoganii]|uniref:hypothetical protein n=1 Tax=Vibrio breoganii TaxID=553239 RepID=UPI000300DC1B|nr:hypothetical protein [Vibrio breoganii]